MTEDRDDESGQTSVLILGVLAVVLMLSAVILGATTVNLSARKLVAEADGAASAAAHTAQSSGIGPSGLPQAQSAQVTEAVEDHLQTSQAHSRHDNLTVSRAWASPTGQTVHVELAATAQLPVLSWVLPAEVEVTGASHARVTVHR
ncbi:hypothetical protein [Garicola koreensis]|uniref:Uncharacterized protein n=1 Tax=Garicola koreensis TaxID=1262554 RepID=A0A7W5TTE1_9MICC|nr:hypothetical protein [Garicola koreensis]MBB3667443.1 hypothetical protein [Garicola koreensis]